MAIALVRPQPTLRELVRDIRQLYAELEQSDKRGEELAASIGQKLAEAKSRKPGGETWENFVKANFNFRRSRADELIRIAGGKTTVEETRLRKRDSVRKSRAKPPLRSGGPTVVQFDPPQRQRRAPKPKNLGSAINQMHAECVAFLNDYVHARAASFIDEHQGEFSQEQKECLMELFEMMVLEFQLLSQRVDGR